MKGILLEKHSRYCIVLSNKGEFVKAKIDNYNHEIGKEIFYELYEPFSISKMFQFPSFKVGLAFSLACLMFIVPFILQIDDNKAYAYMTIDGNSKFKLTLNEDMDVIDIDAFDKDGKAILSKLDGWKGKKAEEVSEQIISFDSAVAKKPVSLQLDYEEEETVDKSFQSRFDTHAKKVETKQKSSVSNVKSKETSEIKETKEPKIKEKPTNKIEVSKPIPKEKVTSPKERKVEPKQNNSIKNNVNPSSPKQNVKPEKKEQNNSKAQAKSAKNVKEKKSSNVNQKNNKK